MDVFLVVGGASLLALAWIKNKADAETKEEISELSVQDLVVANFLLTDKPEKDAIFAIEDLGIKDVNVIHMKMDMTGPTYIGAGGNNVFGMVPLSDPKISWHESTLAREHFVFSTRADTVEYHSVPKMSFGSEPIWSSESKNLSFQTASNELLHKYDMRLPLSPSPNVKVETWSTTKMKTAARFRGKLFVAPDVKSLRTLLLNRYVKASRITSMTAIAGSACLLYAWLGDFDRKRTF